MLGAQGHDKAIVSLTYDGTLPCHAETALPHLDSRGLLATFYADPVPMLDSFPIWRGAAEKGHEIGNGCLIGALDGGSALAAWTPEMVADDIDETDDLIRELFPGQTSFSLGYPWVEGKDSELDTVKRLVAKKHSVCRSGVAGLNALDQVDTGYLKCLPMVDHRSGHMIDLVRTAVRSRSWIILSFDGVGMGERGIDARDHQDLCDWLATNKELFELLPVIAVTALLARQQRSALRML
ncbi:MAG: hypothetical protein JSS66_11750 [Armatimonadetes bacterium]|nr:hypothetical protein [Armatimonadota bacterium]